MSCVTLKFRSNGPTGPDNVQNKDGNWQIFDTLPLECLLTRMSSFAEIFKWLRLFVPIDTLTMCDQHRC